MQDHEAFDTAARIVREQLARGVDIEDALWALKWATDGAMIQSIGGVLKALDVVLVDARDLIETSPAFNPGYAVHRDYRAQLLARLTPAIEAARQTEQP